MTIGCLYLPNGNPAPGPKFDYKLRWLERFLAHAADLLASGGPVVLAGDYNVIPTELDVYKPERWVDDALFRPEVRASYQSCSTRAGPMPCGHMHPGKTIYTFWDYFRNAYVRDAGLRIDHLLLSPAIAPAAKGGRSRSARARLGQEQRSRAGLGGVGLATGHDRARRELTALKRCLDGARILGARCITSEEQRISKRLSQCFGRTTAPHGEVAVSTA